MSDAPEMTLLQLDEHCARLSEAILELLYWDEVSEWLTVASSIETVEVNTAKYDRALMCDDHGYGEARDILVRQFVEDFSVFSLVWGALEGMLDRLKLPPQPSRKGKISAACFHLKNEFRSKTTCLGLREELQSFLLTAQRCIGFASVRNRYVRGQEFGEAGIGLHVVYELRNQFAHGSVVFPRPDADNKPASGHQTLTKHATRIVLLQIQMLLIAHLKHSEHMDEYFWYSEDQVPLSTAVLSLHLERGDLDQASLF